MTHFLGRPSQLSRITHSASPARSSAGPALRLTRMALLALASLVALPLGAQSSAGLSDEERVTAIDVLVSFEHSELGEWARSRRSPGGLQAEDFTVRVAGAERPVIGVEALEDAPAERSGWTQMIYVDCRMVSRGHLEWALAALAERSESLVANGPVEVVVADPAPQTLLAPTRNAELLQGVLGQLTSRASCADLLTRLRDEALSAIQAAEVSARPAVARQALDAEHNLADSSRLALATRLTDGLRREGGAQKSLFLVHPGFPATPSKAYDPYLGDAEPGEHGEHGEPDEHGTVVRLDGETLAAIVASYGWTVIGLEMRREETRAGVYIGDWFFFPDSGAENPEKTAFEEHMDLESVAGMEIDDGDPWQSFLGGLRGKLRENKDAGKAESYLELGNALLGQGKFERAAESFEKALYHFADAPKTRDQQTVAMVQLGNALAEAGDRDRARQAIEAALARDPELAERSAAASVDLGDRGLGELTAATDGMAVRTPEGIDRALVELGGKTRLTFQIVGKPSGELLPLEVDYAGGTTMRHVAWTRSSTPEEVALARLLRLTDRDLRGSVADDGEIDLVAAQREDGSIDLPAALDAAGIAQPRLRLTLASGSTLTGLTAPTTHRHLERAETLRVKVPEGAEFLAVLVEDLETGAWGAGLFGD